MNWKCETCGKPVSDGTGYLHVDEAAAHRAHRRISEHEAATAHEVIHVMSRGELNDLYGNLPGWEVHHRDCDPEPDRCDYWLDTTHINTVSDFLGTIAHLSEKDWVTEATEWSSLIRRGSEVAR